jgi:hypothetical protein
VSCFKLSRIAEPENKILSFLKRKYKLKHDKDIIKFIDVLSRSLDMNNKSNVDVNSLKTDNENLNLNIRELELELNVERENLKDITRSQSEKIHIYLEKISSLQKDCRDYNDNDKKLNKINKDI